LILPGPLINSGRRRVPRYCIKLGGETLTTGKNKV
jgi:hypothetical protein